MSLILTEVSKKFPENTKPTLNNVSLNIENGEFFCVVGRSGCGKSTLLNIIAGLVEPTSGSITLNGEPILGPGADRVVMFQEHALYPWLNVLQNVIFGMELAGIDKTERIEKALFYLDMVGLKDYADYPIHRLSGGMRQRVALARALTLDSKVLLMDEPFSALDKQTSNELRVELQAIWSETGRTIFFITHSVEEAVFLGDRVAVMSPESGSIMDIISIDMNRPRHVYDNRFVEYRHQILGLVQGDEGDRY